MQRMEVVCSEVLCNEWRCCAVNGGAVQRMEWLCSEWRCCAGDGGAVQ